MNDSSVSSIWPTSHALEAATLATLSANRSALNDLPAPWLQQFDDVWLPVACWVAQQKLALGGVPVFGVHGGQGSGKSTLSLALSKLLKAALGWNTVIVSIDQVIGSTLSSSCSG